MPIDQGYHGYDGALHMTQTVPPQKLSGQFLKGLNQMDYKLTDYNGKEPLGAAAIQVYGKNGKRFDHEMAFITPIKDRKNLVILDKSYVTKIVIAKLTKRAKGVIFTHEGKTYMAKSTKEVILSAGTISSPQILMLSGIGPKEHLDSLKIPVHQNLPVGKNYRDEAISVLVFSSAVSGAENLKGAAHDYIYGKGALTRPLAFDTIGFVRTPVEPKEKYPDIEFAFNNISSSRIIQRFFGWSDETYAALDTKEPNPFVIHLIHLHTRSTGTIQLKSADPFDYPLIDPNTLSDEKDIEALYQGVQIALKLLNTPAFRHLKAKLAFDRFPGCNHLKHLSREYWYCYLRRVTSAGMSQVGTCATGTSHENGVVDKHLKVFGVHGLRVADASVIPFTHTDTTAVSTMIGEKVSELIKETYKIVL